MKLHKFTAVLLAAVLPLAAFAQAPEYQNPERVIHEVIAPAESPWPFAASDLPVDPEYRFGVLGNGMRYIIRPNGTPEGQGMVHMRVNAGSFGEDQDQLGYAHFLEHMAFNGSARIPEGEMISLLEREGLAFGPDTNAYTSFDETVYMLNLPRNDADLLDTAVMIMRETASELTIAPDAVAREIGVIESERRVRDTYQLRNAKDEYEFFFPGSRLDTHWPVGTQETIAAATSERIRDYYERWYRPDNVALIVVGDFDPDEAEAVIRRHFADWQANPVESAATAGTIQFDRRGETDIYVDPALSATIDISGLAPWIDRPDNSATRRERVLRQLGYGIINRRLQRLQYAENPPFRAAGIATNEMYKAARSTSLIVQAAEGEWERGLAAAQEEYRHAMEFGFSEAEVAEQVANLRSSIEANAAGAATRNNNDFITGAMTLLTDEQIPTTPESALERFREHEPNITPEAILAALKADLVPLDNPLIRYSGRTAPEGGAEALRAAWDVGMAMALQPREETQLAQFAYTEFGTPGEVVSDVTEQQLGIRQIRFANGLRLNLKPTALQEDRISVQLNIDGGKMLDTRENPLATAMTGSLITGGLGEHTLDELQSILAGRQLGLGISAQEESFRMVANTTPGDLELQLQLFAASLTDPAYRPFGEEQYRRNVANFFVRKDATPGSAVANAEGGFVSDGDPRFSLQSEDAYMALSFDRLRTAISDRWANGAMELALVGDFDADEVVALVARTLGALPARETEFGEYAANRIRQFTDDRSPRVVYHTGDPNQAELRMIWPTRDGEDLREALTLELLERVVRVKLTDTLREELGQTYSPGASAESSRTYPGWGTFTMQAAVTPADIGPAREAMIAVLQQLREAPLDAGELQRSRAPLAETYENLLKTNGGWMGIVDRAQTQADRIERYLGARELLAGLTPEDVQAMAQRYLDPEQRLEITALPTPATE
jgi:zinc protease